MPLKELNIFEKLRGIYHPVTDIRRKVLTEVAKMIETGKPANYTETIPFDIIQKNTPTLRSSVFLERAVVRERIRLTFGRDLKEFGAHRPIIEDIKESMITEKFLSEPIVNVIKIGCERCAEKSYMVTDACRGCIAHPCVLVCPKNAVSIINKKSHIDQDLCIKCGKCQQVCPYSAIIYQERPCAAACGVGAISSDEEGFAEIDYSKCVSCGLCIVSCPWGAIAEKSEIVQLLLAMKERIPIVAAIAPSFVGQFGPLVSPEMVIAGLKKIGFSEIVEVAYGADIVVIDEAQQLCTLIQDKEKSKKQFIGTSCCPSWVLAAQRKFPELAHNISESYTPMIEASKKVKKTHPDAKVVFIGPCISKKIECFKQEVEKFVDFVITFEELAAIFQAKNIHLTELIPEKSDEIVDASQAGRSFPVAGGVANAVIQNVKCVLGDQNPIPTVRADTLADCMKLLNQIKHGRIQPAPLIVEGMACPSGCIGGPGTLAPLNRAQKMVEKFRKQAKMENPQNVE